MDIVWGIIAVVVPLFVGAGFSVMGFTPPEFKLAKIFFVTSAVILGATDIVWHLETKSSLWLQIAVGGIIWGIIGVGMPSVWVWINRRAAVATQAQVVLPLLDFRNEWRKLGKEFEDRPSGPASWQTTNGTTEWFLSDEKCRSLCVLAGSLLAKSPSLSKLLPQVAVTEADPLNRWLLYVRERMPRAWATSSMDWRRANEMVPDKGEIRGIAYTSALICIECAAREV